MWKYGTKMTKLSINETKNMHSGLEVKEPIDAAFLLAVLKNDYAKMTEMLAKGANINETFGIIASYAPKEDAEFCSPSDTPLTYAVQSYCANLVKFLLKNGANP